MSTPSSDEFLCIVVRPASLCYLEQFYSFGDCKVREIVMDKEKIGREFVRSSESDASPGDLDKWLNMLFGGCIAGGRGSCYAYRRNL